MAQSKPARDPVERERAERLGRLVEHLLRHREVSLQKLLELGVPERTARADLLAVSQLRPEKVRGGLILPSGVGRSRLNTPEGRLTFHEVQQTTNVREKSDVADEAAPLFSPAAAIAASAGTSVSISIAAMEQHRMAPVVVTNSLAVIDSCPNVSFLHLVPGQYDREIHALVGPDAVAGFRSESRQYIQGLVGVSGVTVQEGDDASLYVRHMSEVSVLTAMLEHVTQSIVIVADITKLDRHDIWQFASIKGLATRGRAVHLVTNAVEHWREELGERFSAVKTAQDALKGLERVIPGFKLHCAKRRT